MVVAQVYCKVQSTEMFDLVTQYPDTIPSLEELQSLLQQYNITTTQQHPNNHHSNGNQLATTLTKSIQKRAFF